VISEKDLLPVYLAQGYLKAEFDDAQAKVAQDGPQTLVDVSIPVKPGPQYRLADLQWAGNTVFSSDKLLPLVKLKPGELANAVELNKDIEDIHKLYGTKGYLFAHVDPTLEFDDANSAVHYQLNVTEGEQFRMGELIIDGLDPDATKKMTAQWQLKPGDPFDTSYINRFFKVMYRDAALHGSWNVVPRESVNQQNRTVSVILHFAPRA
jgi:outer membrane protein insertion porin family